MVSSENILPHLEPEADDTEYHVLGHDGRDRLKLALTVSIAVSLKRIADALTLERKEGYVSVEVLNVEREVSAMVRAENDKLRAQLIEAANR